MSFFDSFSRTRTFDCALCCYFVAFVAFGLQSEVRVRHRDESRNVTRLTMENVSAVPTGCVCVCVRRTCV